MPHDEIFRTVAVRFVVAINSACSLVYRLISRYIQLTKTSQNAVILRIDSSQNYAFGLLAVTANRATREC